MAQIYSLGGRQVYDDMGRTIDAKTGQAIQQAPASPATGERTLQNYAESPSLSFTRGQAQGVAQQAGNTDVGGQFGLLLMDLLKQHQQLGTRPFAEQGFNAQSEQARRLGAQTPSNLIGASPTVQNQARDAFAGALQPTIKGAQQGAQTFSEQLKSFGSGLEMAQSFLKGYQEQENKVRDDARSLINNAFSQFGGGAFEGADPQQLQEIEKKAGYPKGYLSSVAKTIKERELQLKQQMESERIAQKSIMGGLTANQINQTVNQIAGAFDNEPIVKAYNTTQEGYQTIKSIGIQTKSPADDIAFIYAFAKIMDPNSVVREGEYNTIQRYAQTWADNFGFKAKRIFSNTNFLGADAKQKMLNAIQSKVNTIQKQYNNLHSEYQRQMDDARTGKPRQITNYGAAFQQEGGGLIRVRRNSDGMIGRVPENEFDPSVYTKL